MDFSLLGNNFLIVLSLLAGASFAAIACYEVFRWHAHLYKKPKPSTADKKLFLKRRLILYAAIVAASFLLAILAEILAEHFVPSSELPNRLWLMALPLTTSLMLAILLWLKTKFWLKAASSALVILGAIFTLALANSYYNFFPTLYSVFSPDTRAILARQSNDLTTIQYSGSSLRAHHLRVKTVESSLFGLNASDDGKVFSFIAPGTVSHFTPRVEWGYVPAIAASSKARIRLPVIVLLTGDPGLVYGWLDHGLKHTLDRFSAEHHGITPYVFLADDTGMLNNDTECVNSPRGNIETYLTTDLPNYIKSHYSVETSASNWGIGGLSMGGTCAVMLALRHPDVYSLFMDFSGEIAPEIGSKKATIDQLFGGSASAYQHHQPLYLLAHTSKSTLGGMSGFFGVGSGDSPEFLMGTKTLYQAARRVGLNSRFESVGGAHNWSAWEQLLRGALPWASNRLGATN